MYSAPVAEGDFVTAYLTNGYEITGTVTEILEDRFVVVEEGQEFGETASIRYDRMSSVVIHS